MWAGDARLAATVFPAFDGWIAVVQQVLESIRIFVGGDAKIQVRLAVNLHISIGFRF